jgi:hypothetical protein
MANGEVVFDAPWQGRVFGMAHSLCEAGCYEWREFQSELIRVIGAAEGSASAGADGSAGAGADGSAGAGAEGSAGAGAEHYYQHFLAALSALVARKGLVTAASLDQRVAGLALRPHDHDHHHRQHHHHAHDDGDPHEP